MHAGVHLNDRGDGPMSPCGYSTACPPPWQSVQQSNATEYSSPLPARDVPDKSQQVQLVPIMRTPPNDMSFMSMGVMQGMTLHLPAGGSAVHSFGLCFLVPGLFEIFGSLEPTLADSEGESSGKAMHVAGTKLYVLVMK